MSSSQFVVVALAAATSLLLTSCASPAEGGPAPRDRSDPPAFSGVFADEYRQTWIESGNAFVHGVIEDEKITEQEWAEVTSRLTDCLAQEGIEFQGFTVEGGYSAQTGDMDGERANQLMGACEADSGEAYIGWLRMMAITNPENRDVAELMAECLVRKGAVAPGYTAADYHEDVTDQSFPFLDPSEGADISSSCNDDPLSLLPNE